MSKRFDDLSRGLSESRSRRGALKLIGATAAAAVTAAVLRPLRGGAVTCPAGAPVCGAGCCDKGATCTSPSASCCCPKGTTPCGTSCCSKGVACIDAGSGLCGCPAGYTPCGSGSGLTCCAAGQACGPGCPTAVSLATAATCVSATTSTSSSTTTSTTACSSNGQNCDTTPCCPGLACSRGTCIIPDCFTGSTRVLMADGSERAIEDIEAGDVVLGSNGQVNLVLDIKRPALGARPLYALNDDDYFVTAAHPFLTSDGWKSIDPIRTATEHPVVETSQMQLGDRLVAADARPPSGVCGNVRTATRVRHSALTRLRSRLADPGLTIYNLRVDGDHTYFANGFVVHNK